ncbi:MAG: hypothetical protein QM756_25410 [Polyangiaceae bacterium]
MFTGLPTTLKPVSNSPKHKQYYSEEEEEEEEEERKERKKKKTPFRAEIAQTPTSACTRRYRHKIAMS